jgi:hypothetical protein
MSPTDTVRDLEQISRDLDFLLFTLERSQPPRLLDPPAERKRLLRELEALRERLDEVVRSLD